MRTRPSFARTAPWLTPLLLGLLTGCGGHHHRHKTIQALGSAHLAIDWPSGRANSHAANIKNLRVTVLSGPKTVASVDVAKPNQLDPFYALPVGDYKLDIQARETIDESGAVVAGVGIPLTVVANKSAETRFSLTTDVDHIEVSPSTLTLEALAQGDLILTARDAAGSFTLGNVDSLVLTSSAPDVATSDFTGVVTAGSKGGTATLSFTDTSVGRTATSTVTVLPPPAIALSPNPASVAPKGSIRFGATVVGLIDPSLTWSVAEGAVGGGVDASGRYVAPVREGVYHVVATSVSRPGLSVAVPVVVGSAGVSTTVH